MFHNHLILEHRLEIDIGLDPNTFHILLFLEDL